ncbi:protein yippee-like 4 isoform X1 [Pteropus medius]|uniref:protein yippee-like 4 isoform X1 n=1 Tax=Pteropus vampyrus TaxID=132908 RepID=UPI00196A618C|nr:protein yippee-like 4 isoform X1 [Pteropus giganteus]XP_039716075.1 protein yippee-like 4 isoform X1 [Pteropus giganteus]
MPSCDPGPGPACLPAKTFRSYLPRCHRTYSCVHCRAHLAKHDELISKSFQGSHGRAYLFNSVVNVGCGPAEQRLLLTGLHSVADIFCESCKTTLGWKYVSTWGDPPKWSLHGPPSPSDCMSGLLRGPEGSGWDQVDWMGRGILGTGVIELVGGPGREQLGPTFTASSPPGTGL